MTSATPAKCKKYRSPGNPRRQIPPMGVSPEHGGLRALTIRFICRPLRVPRRGSFSIFALSRGLGLRVSLRYACHALTNRSHFAVFHGGGGQMRINTMPEVKHYHGSASGKKSYCLSSFTYGGGMQPVRPKPAGKAWL